jgi:hypothetical protein
VARLVLWIIYLILHWLWGGKKEVFSAETQNDKADDGAFELILTRSNLQLHVPANKSALEVIEDAGVEIEAAV